MEQMHHIKKNLLYYDANGKRVTPADPQLLMMDEDRKNQAMKDAKKRLKREEALRANILHKMSQVTKMYAEREIKFERQLEKLQAKLLEKNEDQFGLKAAKLDRMKKKHARMDFMDKVKRFPEDIIKSADQRRRIDYKESDEDSSSSQDEENIKQLRDPAQQIIFAERKLRQLLKQSDENPFQLDMVEELPPQYRRVYDNPDLHLKDAEERATIEGKVFERNRHIAVLDELKDRKQDAKDYKIKYQYRVLLELLSADKLVKQIRAQHKKKSLEKIASKTTNDTLAELNELFSEEMAQQARRHLEEQMRRQRNQATTEKLYKVIKKSEASELRTFDLKDKKQELRHHLEVNKDLDNQAEEYLKFEQEKGKKKEAVLAKLKQKVAEVQAEIQEQADSINQKNQHLDMIKQKEKYKALDFITPQRIIERNSLKNLIMAKSINSGKEQGQDQDKVLLNFGEVCEEVANELTRSITQCRKSTIMMRKEQSKLVKQRADLSEMLEMTQRDFEIAVKHTRNLIQQKARDLQQQQALKDQGPLSPEFLSTEENSLTIQETNVINTMQNASFSALEYQEQQKKEVLGYLKSKLRMIKLLRMRTFPPQRDFIQETVNVMSVAETIRDNTPRKPDIYHQKTNGVQNDTLQQQLFNQLTERNNQQQYHHGRAISINRTEIQMPIESVMEEQTDKESDERSDSGSQEKNRVIQMPEINLQEDSMISQAENSVSIIVKELNAANAVNQDSTAKANQQPVETSLLTRNENEFTVDQSLYRSKSAPKLSTTSQQSTLPKFRVSKLPDFKNNLLDDLNHKQNKINLRAVSQKKIIRQRKLIKEAIVSNAREHKNILIKKRSSPDRKLNEEIGDTLPASVRQEIRLPFINMRKLNQDKSTLSKFLLSRQSTQGAERDSIKKNNSFQIKSSRSYMNLRMEPSDIQNASELEPKNVKKTYQDQIFVNNNSQQENVRNVLISNNTQTEKIKNNDSMNAHINESVISDRFSNKSTVLLASAKPQTKGDYISTFDSDKDQFNMNINGDAFRPIMYPKLQTSRTISALGDINRVSVAHDGQKVILSKPASRQKLNESEIQVSVQPQAQSNNDDVQQ